MTSPSPFGGPQAMQPPPAPKGGVSTGCIILLVVGLVGVSMIGIMAVLAIYGTRKYLVAAKSAEAKNTIGAISRAAAAGYDRDTLDASGGVTHVLCPSSGAVPALVPKGMKYQPGPLDFQTPGWKCLRFVISSPTYYQYQYNQGGGYVAAATAPGPNGFEAAAQGDLDANGIKSTFSRTGTIGPSGNVVLSTSMFIENESE